jgi:hypothetical protein
MDAGTEGPGEFQAGPYSLIRTHRAPQSLGDQREPGSDAAARRDAFHTPAKAAGCGWNPLLLSKLLIAEGGHPPI